MSFIYECSKEMKFLYLRDYQSELKEDKRHLNEVRLGQGIINFSLVKSLNF